MKNPIREALRLERRASGFVGSLPSPVRLDMTATESPIKQETFEYSLAAEIECEVLLAPEELSKDGAKLAARLSAEKMVLNEVYGGYAQGLEQVLYLLANHRQADAVHGLHVMIKSMRGLA